MAERKRSSDASKDSEKYLEEDGTAEQQGRAGGTLQRDIASRDELKRANEAPADKTRVTKSDEKGESDG